MEGREPLIAVTRSAEVSAGEGVAAVVFDLDGVIIVSSCSTEKRRELAEQSGGRWLDEAQERMQGLSLPSGPATCATI